jgi:CheY-like chemotaxis protein
MPKVLIVEDEKNLALAYRTILEKQGYAVVVAYDGEEGLQAVADNTPDLILLDMKMPRMSGLEFLRHLDTKGSGANTRVIVFSNQDAQAEIDEAFKLGAKRYLLKSWAAPHDLVKVVEEALKS